MPIFGKINHYSNGGVEPDTTEPVGTLNDRPPEHIFARGGGGGKQVAFETKPTTTHTAGVVPKDRFQLI